MSRNANLDLGRIITAEAESRSGVLTAAYDSMLTRADDLTIEGADDAVFWKGGDTSGDIQPVMHPLTDRMCNIGALSVAEVLGLPYYAFDYSAQARTDLRLAQLGWIAEIPMTYIKWSTRGSGNVDVGDGEQGPIYMKSGNAPWRVAMGVCLSDRPHATHRTIRSMPMMPYSQDRNAFEVRDDEECTIHSEMNSPGLRIPHSVKYFLKELARAGCGGMVWAKGTQAQEDGVFAGIAQVLISKTSFNVSLPFDDDFTKEFADEVNFILSRLPDGFYDELEGLGEGQDIRCYISDYGYAQLQNAVIDQAETITLTNDLDGDRGTDLDAATPDVLRRSWDRLLDHLAASGSLSADRESFDSWKLWQAMGYRQRNGKDMSSTMVSTNGSMTLEMTLGTADKMWLRILENNNDETVGGTRNPYDPKIHWDLTCEAYRVANPGNERLAAFLDDAQATFVKLLDEKLPFLELHNRLLAEIAPWHKVGATMTA